MAVDKVIIERRQAIRDAAIAYLSVPSPFSVWEPSKMKFTLADETPIKSHHELEGYYYQGLVTKSDMFYLKAIHAYGFCTKATLQKLMIYWKKKDINKAFRDQRQPLAIPDAEDKEKFRLRFGMLKKYGMLCCHSFYTRGGYTKGDSDMRTICTIPGIPTAIYRSVLEDNSYTYDNRMPYLSESEIMRRVQNSVLSAAFLDSPFLVSAKYNYIYRLGREKKVVLCVLDMAQDGVAENPYRLIVDSITLHVNENVITKKDRQLTVARQIKELCDVMRAERENGVRCYLMLCAEDAEGMVFIQKTIYELEPGLLSYVLITTGTLLEMNTVLTEPDNLGKCFFEFDREDRYKMVGATGFYFLPWRDR